VFDDELELQREQRTSLSEGVCFKKKGMVSVTKGATMDVMLKDRRIFALDMCSRE